MIYVLSSQAQGAKSLGSATDANVNSEENAQKDSVVRGLGLLEFTTGAHISSPVNKRTKDPTGAHFV